MSHLLKILWKKQMYLNSIKYPDEMGEKRWWMITEASESYYWWKTWCFQPDPETKRQSYQRLSHCTLRIYWTGKTVNGCYLEVLKKLWDSVRRKRPELSPENWIIHHDNPPSHSAFPVRLSDKKRNYCIRCCLFTQMTYWNFYYFRN